MINTGKIAPYWIQTHSGGAFDLSDPRPEMICIEDIAHALAQINRYTGHAAWPYSVAQHSIMVAETVHATAPELALVALMHDAGEAYLGDWSSPLKALMRGHGDGVPSRADLIAEGVDRALDHKFELFATRRGTPGRAVVKQADLIALATEKRDLFGPPPRAGWGDATGFTLPAPLETPCERWEWYQAKVNFLKAFDRFGGVR